MTQDWAAHWSELFHVQADVVTAFSNPPVMLSSAQAWNPRHDLVVVVDTLHSGVHFPEAVPAQAVGHKALAVNLSDLAAMAAIPVSFTVTLMQPDFDAEWLTGFHYGLMQLAVQSDCRCLHANLLRGPLSVTVQAQGYLQDKALTRSGAHEGDHIVVSGTLGDAAYGLHCWQQGECDLGHAVLDRLNYPQPRLALGQALAGLAGACIDVSDGLSQDLGHILDASRVGAHVQGRAIPLSPTLQQIDHDFALQCALYGGDDYELCFTMAPQYVDQLDGIALASGCSLTEIGVVTDAAQRLIELPGGEQRRLAGGGFDHFAGMGR